eukprot:9324912-Pyramimonas_sp.AAC.1
MHLVGGEQKCVKGRAMVSNVSRAEGWGLAQHLRDTPHPSLFLTDFAAAFPSLAQCWLFFALQRMGIEAYVIRFFWLV